MLPNNTICRLRSLVPMLMVLCCAVVVSLLATTSFAVAQQDACGYPAVGAIAGTRPAAKFDENTVLRSFSPKSKVLVRRGNLPTIRAFYSDEHALALGIRLDIPKGGSGTVNTASTPQCASVGVGGVGFLGSTDPAGRPIFPSLFITDLGPIGHETNSKAGDWQQQADNLSAIIPSSICGVTKSAFIDATGQTKVDADPVANGTITGSSDATDVPSEGWTALKPEKYTAVIRWDLVNLTTIGGLFKILAEQHT